MFFLPEFRMNHPVDANHQGKQKITSWNQIECQTQAAAQIPDIPHQPGKECTTGNTRTGQQNKYHSFVCGGQTIRAIALDTGPEWSCGKSGQKQQDKEKPQMIENGKTQRNEGSAHGRYYNQPA